jgi:MHS family proline/betaine transporter-like MFS transporter
MIGNGLEWYDFALYGYFAPILGKLFFPGDDPYLQMIQTYGIFAAGFFMRPVGAVFFGSIGDKFGRKFALTLSLLMMAVPTACIGLLPTYAAIGIWAPVLLALVRMMQGLALAGQFTGSVTFIIEHTPAGKRGAAGGATIMSLCAGMLMGSAAATIMAHLLSPAALEDWGWRVPFLLGIVIAFVGFYIRRHTEESPHYEKAKEEGRLSQTPVRETLTQHGGKLVRGVLIYLSVTVPFYIVTVFINGYLTKVLGYPVKDALFIATCSMILLMFLVVPTAALSDRIGRKRLLMATAVVYFVASYPIFWLMTQPGFASAFGAVMLMTLILGFYVGAAPTVFVELFPTSVRYTGLSLSYNICAAAFGGTAPGLCFWLIKNTQMSTVPALYIMLCAALSFIAFIGYHDRYKEELE